MRRSVSLSPAVMWTQLWITETAAAWASGTAGVCDGFVSGFWWMDQLGMAATSGHAAMCRQCLVGGNYSLLDQLNGLTPNPDYWSGNTLIAALIEYLKSQVLAITGPFLFSSLFHSLPPLSTPFSSRSLDVMWHTSRSIQTLALCCTLLHSCFLSCTLFHTL
jgi:hypothetical protein